MQALMKILVRDLRTGLLMDRGGGWTSVPADALQFPTIEEAGGQALRPGEEDMVVVLKYEQPACELAIYPAYCARV